MTTKEENTIGAADVQAMKKPELISLIEENELEIEGYKDMTVPQLKAAVLKVLDLEDESEEEEEETDTKPKGKSVTYTYVGAGEDSPRVINFMGKQKFVRGVATPVSDPEVLAKIKGSHTFVKGEADQETLHQIDEEAKAHADKQRAEDKLAEIRHLQNLKNLKKI